MANKRPAQNRPAQKTSAQKSAQKTSVQKRTAEKQSAAKQGAQSRPVQQRIDPRTARSGRPGGRSPKAPQVRKATARDWIGGARLRTLPLSIAPVVLGTGAAYSWENDEGWHWVRALLCLAVAVGLQIGVNYANDYSDGIRGTDAYRVGPSRLTGSGAAKPRTVLTVAIVFFALAGLAGIAVSILSGFPWLIAVGAVCIVAAYFYTGGKRPYGYYGLGEVFVFVFFGLVATVGTMFVQVAYVSFEAWLGAVALGLLACAVLMVNNIRDAEQDRRAGKRTLAVLIGNLPSRITFAVLTLAPFAILIPLLFLYPNAFYVYFALLAALPAVIITLTGRTPPEFVLALQLTSLTSLLYAVGLAVALAF